MCRYYEELHNIFGAKNSECQFPVYDSAVTTNMIISSTPEHESSLNEQSDFCGFENSSTIDDCPLTSIREYMILEEEPALSSSEGDCVEVQPTTSRSPPTTSSSTSGQKNKPVQEFASKLKRCAPKNALDKLSAIQSERNDFLRTKIEFEREKFKMEFDLKTRQFEDSIKERKEQHELKKMEIEKEERLRALELELKYKSTSQNGL
ncbi:uncharacterized protein [Musca autumnalis]|uniref:uncharacterized protein n=1 Tax=Musca autumnalis TaxID=221902 RepID=UPI003CF04C07